MKYIGVLASGGGSLMEEVIQNVTSGKVAVVISSNPVARILDRATKHRLPSYTIQPCDYTSRETYDTQIKNVLERHQVDVVVLIGFKRILSRVMTDAYPYRIINLHPALLPAFQGFDPQQQALDYGARITGCTTHFVDEGVDTGPIILQASLGVRQGETLHSLCERLRPLEKEILVRTVQLVCEENYELDGRTVLLQTEGENDD